MTTLPIAHEIKEWPEYFAQIWARVRGHEIRRQRPGATYQAGQTVLIREWFPARQVYSGRWIRAEITCVTEAGTIGSNVSLPSPLCVFSFVENFRGGPPP